MTVTVEEVRKALDAMVRKAFNDKREVLTAVKRVTAAKTMKQLEASLRAWAAAERRMKKNPDLYQRSGPITAWEIGHDIICDCYSRLEKIIGVRISRDEYYNKVDKAADYLEGLEKVRNRAKINNVDEEKANSCR